MEISKKHDLDPTIFQVVHYTKKELETAEYYQIILPDPLELEGTDASDYGTQYTGGCPHCGLGKKPVSDVLVDRKFMKKYNIGCLGPDIYVSEAFKELISSNGLTGISFKHEVKDFKGREMSKYFCMDIHNILPPTSESVWLVKEEYVQKCYEKCGHQVIYLRSDIQYEKQKLEEAQDFNLTIEYINNFRLREIIISAKTRNLFKQNKIYARYLPVAIF